MTRQHIVFLTGAGVSAESGLSTFRGKDGMWTNEEWVHLASTDALYNETQKCLDFYNWRRKKLAEVEPNDAHRMIAELEKEHDNLHERAGSTRVIHLHGELSKVCSMDNRTTCVKEYPLTTPIRVGDKAEDGSQLRPYIVMFGEYVDSMNVAIDIVSKADIFVVIGTSLKVYPAAGFINYAHHEVPKFVIDPGEMEQCTHLGFTHFKTTATEGKKMLLEAFGRAEEAGGNGLALHHSMGVRADTQETGRDVGVDSLYAEPYLSAGQEASSPYPLSKGRGGSLRRKRKDVSETGRRRHANANGSRREFRRQTLDFRR